MQGDNLVRKTSQNKEKCIHWLKNGFLQIDDVRKKEKYPALGLNFIKLGLQDVLYNPATGEIYTPNTDKSSSLNGDKSNKKKEGEIDESGDS